MAVENGIGDIHGGLHFWYILSTIIFFGHLVAMHFTCEATSDEADLDLFVPHVRHGFFCSRGTSVQRETALIDRKSNGVDDTFWIRGRMSASRRHVFGF